MRGASKFSKEGSVQVKLGSYSGGERPELTPGRKAVYDLLRKGMSNAEVAKERSTSERAVRKVKLYLIENGYQISGSSEVPETGHPPGAGTSGRYRVHDFTISLPIHWCRSGYRDVIRRGNVRRRDGHLVQLFPTSVVVRGSKGFSFWGVDADDGLAQAHDYWTRFIQRIEGWYGLVLLKHDCVFSLSYEVAEINNDFAEDQARRKDWIKVRSSEDGKVWLEFDHSDTFEADAVHGLTAGDDMQRVVAPVFNDYRDNANSLRKPSETWRLHDDLAEQQLRLAGEIRALEAVTLRLVESQTSFYGAQASLTKLKTSLLKAGVPDNDQSERLDDWKRWGWVG